MLKYKQYSPILASNFGQKGQENTTSYHLQYWSCYHGRNVRVNTRCFCLTGITLQGLWVRLEEREPKFSLKLDDKSKQYVWSIIVSQDNIQIYELQEPRGDLIIYDRFKYCDPETGISIVLNR